MLNEFTILRLAHLLLSGYALFYISYLGFGFVGHETLQADIIRGRLYQSG